MIFQEFEQVPEVPNYKEQDDNHHEQAHYPDYHPGGSDQDQEQTPQYDYDEDYEGLQPAQVQEKQPEQDYDDYYQDYEESGPEEEAEERKSSDFDDKFNNKAYDDFYHSDGNQGDFFGGGPNFDDFFKKIETGIEDEITTSPKHYHQDHENPKARQANREVNYDEVTYNDLNPENYDNNHPDTIEFRMPSHDELQKNYKTQTSASNQIEHIVQFEPSIKKTKLRRRVRISSKH